MLSDAIAGCSLPELCMQHLNSLNNFFFNFVSSSAMLNKQKKRLAPLQDNMEIITYSHLDDGPSPDCKGREGLPTSSHDRKFLNEHANSVLIGMRLKHTNTHSCRHCVFAGGEEA